MYTDTHTRTYIHTFSDYKLELSMSLPSLSSTPPWKPQAALYYPYPQDELWNWKEISCYISCLFFSVSTLLMTSSISWYTGLLTSLCCFILPQIRGSVEDGLSTPQPGLKRLWFFVLKFLYSFFWLRWGFAAACGFSLIVAGRGYSRRRQWHPTPVSCLENPMDRGAWWAAVHGVAKSRT